MVDFWMVVNIDVDVDVLVKVGVGVHERHDSSRHDQLVFQMVRVVREICIYYVVCICMVTLVLEDEGDDHHADICHYHSVDHAHRDHMQMQMHISHCIDL